MDEEASRAFVDLGRTLLDMVLGEFTPAVDRRLPDKGSTVLHRRWLPDTHELRIQLPSNKPQMRLIALPMFILNYSHQCSLGIASLR